MGSPRGENLWPTNRIRAIAVLQAQHHQIVEDMARTGERGIDHISSRFTGLDYIGV